jgi:hypothetical protein
MALGENGYWQLRLLPWTVSLSGEDFSQCQKDGTYMDGVLILPKENLIGLLEWAVHQNHS